MRDIRADLQERLDAAGREREELQRRISELEPLEIAIRALFKRENETFAATSPAQSFSNSADIAAGTFAAKDPREVVKPHHWDQLKVGS